MHEREEKRTRNRNFMAVGEIIRSPERDDPSFTLEITRPGFQLRAKLSPPIV